MVGTAFEFFDYYIYAAAAVLVFNTQFFHSDDPLSNDLLSLSTLALAFFARPIGSALFGHFGDKIGRKKTLVASLVLMGGSTVVIGLLPNYAQIGIWAPILLCVCRVGQGIGLGGEWGGAALVATENAPEGKRAWYGTFPQLGAPIGLFVANATFFLVSYFWGQQALVEWAWRIPFVSSLPDAKAGAASGTATAIINNFFILFSFYLIFLRLRLNRVLYYLRRAKKSIFL